ncbi:MULTISPECIES: methyltransferase domain-containing protein [unclassified Streptomyces]|uniref:class I SAM-dependent methyltransferase n=1 Tax=unclassified Streptomyces TaxID=2593676 RepID=UPI0006F6C488|nr:MULTISPECIES: methyltransferase domain-containing protein [unclassified Streptomyces]KQX47752.1 methyltransferase type 11 [Streptomyces sp. Root1304]KRA94892.1 methyltransferase type 11 [Streptomyces sp. Root66D1]
MTPTLVPHHPARDWAEIQERMLVPLYEAVYERLGVGAGSRVLGLGCGSGLALLMAAGRGARVTGADRDHARVELARERLPEGVAVGGEPPGAGPYDVITAFHATDGLLPELLAVTRSAQSGAAVVLAGWGPPERCATEPVLRVAERLADGGARRGFRADLDGLVAAAGLHPAGSGRVACPFGYASGGSAVRGLLSTGAFDEAVRATELAQVEKEIEEALAPHLRADGTVWMPNEFRYVVARVP